MKDKLREDRRDAIAKAIADTIGHGMREKCERHADAVLAVLDAEGDGGAVAWVADLAPGIERPKEYMGIFTPYKNYADHLAKHPDYVVTPLCTHPARSGVVSDEDVRDAARWRFFCDNIGSEYGDGYSEPRENSACLEWQQGPWIRDGSNGGQGRADTFPGWSAIIDKMMEAEQRALEELDDPTDAAIQRERHER